MADVRPLVIIGAGRSGTKFLRDTLAASAEADAVPFDVNFLWRVGHERVPHDILPASEVDDRFRRYIRRSLRRMAGVAARTDTPVLIEKTVSNSLRVPFVVATLPDARFIHLIRDGREVIESALRMWRDPPSAGYLRQKLRYLPIRNLGYAFWYARNMVAAALGDDSRRLWGPRYPGMEDELRELPLIEVVSRQWQQCVDHATQDLGQLERERVLTVRYSDLVASDADAIRGLCSFAGISDTQAVLDAFGATLRRDTQGKWQDGLSADEKRVVSRVCGQTLVRHGFIAEEESAERRELTGGGM